MFDEVGVVRSSKSSSDFFSSLEFMQHMVTVSSWPQSGHSGESAASIRARVALQSDDCPS